MTESTTSATVSIPLEGTLWAAEGTWPRVIDHLASRFARVRPLEVEHVADRPLADQVTALNDWAGDDIDWVREATRWLDENLAMYVKPDRATNQVVRAIAERAQLEVATALPRPIAEAVLRHVGLLRSVGALQVLTSPATGTIDITSGAGAITVASPAEALTALPD